MPLVAIHMEDILVEGEELLDNENVVNLGILNVGEKDVKDTFHEIHGYPEDSKSCCIQR